MIRKVLAGTALLVVVAAGIGAYVLTRRPVPGDRVEVVVPAGASTSAIANLLQTRGVIDSTAKFRVLSKLRGMDGRLRAGSYELRLGMGAQAALDVLASGPIEKATSVTIPEGYTVRQVAARVGERTHISEEEMLAVATSGEVRWRHQPEDVTSLEGFLFPETYVVGERETAIGLLRRMVQEFESRTSDLDWSVPESRGLSRYQAVVLASLVEREAKLDEDRAQVAAVVYNRLSKGMRLQIDITALYDAPRHKIPTRRDLQRQSAYNTYLNDGLPPTPIANPGLESLRAAVAPADSDAIYYVVIDRSGKHGFASTSQEFQRLRQQCPPEFCGRRR